MVRPGSSSDLTRGQAPGLPLVTVVGLGPGSPGLVTAETLDAIRAVPARFLRTDRHPSAHLVPGAQTFDYLYEQADELPQVYAGIVDALVKAALEAPGGHILYAVPGSPMVAERSVELLRADPRVRAAVLPAVSFLDLAFQRLGVDPLGAGARIIDGHRFAIEAAGYQGAALIGQCDSASVLSEVKLAIGAVLEQQRAGEEGAPELVVLQRLGSADEVVTRVPWYDLDRSVVPDHLTSLWAPRLALPFAPEMARLDELVRTLRAKCPWDRQQTHQSLTRYLLEESYEVVEAIDELVTDGYGHLEEELGDVLFQVFFHSALAAEQGQFTVADVARTVHDKLVARHPHVFGDVQARTPEEVVRNWEQIKRAEKGRAGLMDGIPANLPALLYAHKVQRKAASVGFDWEDARGALAKVPEELDELAALLPPADRAGDAGPERSGAIGEELGDLLFAVVNVARHLHIDPEAALREATVKFRRRFSAVEALASQRGVDMAAAGLGVLDSLWDEVKAAEA